MGVEDLLQKHSLLESDIAIVGNRVNAINSQATVFVDSDFPEVQGLNSIRNRIFKFSSVSCFQKTYDKCVSSLRVCIPWCMHDLLHIG